MRSLQISITANNDEAYVTACEVETLFGCRITAFKRQLAIGVVGDSVLSPSRHLALRIRGAIGRWG